MFHFKSVLMKSDMIKGKGIQRTREAEVESVLLVCKRR